MANYILKYKGTYRLLPEIDQSTNDFPRNYDGSIADEDVYIACRNNCRIITYGHIDNGRDVYLMAYIPSIGRGRNIKKSMDEKGVPYIDYFETDIEAEFKFKAKYITEVATLMQAKTGGANISPFSPRNLPRANVSIPTEKIERYKAITAKVQKEDLLIIHNITTAFLSNILTKKCRTANKKFDCVADMRKLKMSRMIKEYIYTKDLWDEYLVYLEKQIEKFYKDKSK